MHIWSRQHGYLTDNGLVKMSDQLKNTSRQWQKKKIINRKNSLLQQTDR